MIWFFWCLSATTSSSSCWVGPFISWPNQGTGCWNVLQAGEPPLLWGRREIAWHSRLKSCRWGFSAQEPSPAPWEGTLLHFHRTHNLRWSEIILLLGIQSYKIIINMNKMQRKGWVIHTPLCFSLVLFILFSPLFFLSFPFLWYRQSCYCI